MTLAVVERAGDDRDVAVGLELQPAHLVGRGRRDFEIVADADAAQQALLLALFLAPGEAVDVGQLQRLIEQHGELAAVVGRTGRGLVRHLFRLDVVALAHLDLVDAHLARRGRDQPLHEVVGLGTAGAAIGADRRGVREADLGLDLDQRRAIDRRQIARDAERAHGGADVGEIAAEVGVALQADGQEHAVLVEGELAVEIMVAAVLVAEEGARAIVGPLHRATKKLRGMEEARIFGIGRALHAERTADIAGHDPHLRRLDVEQLGHLVLEAEHALAAGVERRAIALLVVVTDRRTRLHRADDDAVADEAQLGHMRGLGEGFGDLGAVAVLEVGADILWHVVEHQRRARLGGGAGFGDGGQRLDVEHDGFRGVLGLRQRLGDHEGHRIAHEVHLLGGERIACRRLHLRAVAVGRHHHRLERTVACRVEILAGPDAEHARHLPGFVGVDAPDQPVRDLAAHHHGIGLLFEVYVVAVAALALQQGRVFLAMHRLADAEFHQIKVVRRERCVHGPSVKKGGKIRLRS